MSELPWKIFEKTGNPEAYLLLKQVEKLDQDEGQDIEESPDSLTEFEPKS